MFFFFQAEDGIRDTSVTGVQTCALPISDHAPERDDGIEALTRGSGLGDDGELERARNPRDFHIRVRDAAATQRVARALQEPGGDVLVKTAYDDRHAPLTGGRARGRRRAVGVGSHDQWVRKWPSLSLFTSR